MLDTLKIKNWSEIRPFKYYLTLMKGKVDTARDELLFLHKKGTMWRRYIIEDNVKMQETMIDMCSYDNLI